MKQSTSTAITTTALLLLGSLPILTGSMSLVAINAGLSGLDVPAENQNYVNHPLPIVVHILSGIIFNLLGPFQFILAIRQRWPMIHRVSGRLFILAGLVSAVSALWMNQFFPAFGGILKYSSNLIFGLGSIIAIGLALHAILRRRVLDHRAWMIRAYAMGLGVATQRLLLMPYFFAFGIPQGETLGALLWICWLINMAVAEWVIRRRKTSIFEW
jgi:uncharacterized membrane protein